VESVDLTDAFVAGPYPGPANARATADEATRAAALRQRADRENFPVALRILPAGLRADLEAVYGFARTTDELGDSPAPPAERIRRLEAWRADLARVWDDGAPGHGPTHPALRALQPVVRRHGLGPEPFADLVEANLVDQRVTRYADWDELMGYCRLSAQPVGRIVLGLFGETDPVTALLSDRVCSALQVLEHCQDVAEDHRAGRIYLPADRMAVHGVTPGHLAEPVAGPGLRRLVLETTGRASALLEDGAPVVDRLRGWARLCVAGFVAGGRSTAAALRRSGGDVLARDTRPSRATTAREAARLFLLGAGRRSR
jgi:squalene synthase HpnC